MSYVDGFVLPVPTDHSRGSGTPPRAQRDRVNARVMKDPRIAGMDPRTMPFDAKRMFWGGFKTLVSV